VVDSIRWVLGEQKTSMLRLEKMENLIFNGTRSRKPSALAEVSLTFENTKNLVSSDYKTITITRKLFRDGESEYRLNDVACQAQGYHYAVYGHRCECGLLRHHRTGHGR
jgi:chromosome segregation protein